MPGNKLEQDIINIFNKDIALSLSINQIAKRLRKSYPHIHSKVRILIKAGVLHETRIGKNSLCSVNLASESAVCLLGINEARKKEDFLRSNKEIGRIQRIIAILKDQLAISTAFLSNQRLILVIDRDTDSKIIKEKFAGTKNQQLELFSKDSFQKAMLKETPYFSNVIILYSVEKYFELISQIHDKLKSEHLFGRNKNEN